jgi:outer membrane protein OmpU
MKKLLYGTTALATAGLILGAAGSAKAQQEGEKKMSIEIHGYHQQWAVFNGGQDPNSPGGADIDLSTVDQKHNSEICFTGEMELEAGFAVGINVQMEANTSADQIDESYMYIESEKYGMLILGDENNAAYLLQVVAPDGGINHNQGDLTSMPNQGLLVTPQGWDLNNTTIDGTRFRFGGDNDSGKFTYISPRFAGFQIGASYIPNYESTGGDNNNSITRISLNNAQTTGGPGNANTSINEGAAVGLNYKGAFTGWGLQASAGYQYGNTVGKTAGGSADDLNAVGGGVQVNFGGLVIGGSYALVDGDKANGGKYDGQGYDVGVAYSFGPYKVGLTYMRGENDGINSDMRGDYLVLSSTYKIGPGVDLVGGVYGFDLDGENGAAAPGQVSDNDGWGAATAFKLSF